MQNLCGNMDQGALSPCGSSMSGSSEQSSNELNQHQMKSKLVAQNATMDYNMRNLELKMQGKRDELKNLLKEKASNISGLENSKKQLTLLQDRESSLATAISRIRDNNIVSEGLESAVIQNLKAIKITNEEQKSKWETMIREYSATMNSHQEIYSSLPWVKEKRMLANQVEKKRIFLERLKLHEEDNKAKQLTFEKISREKLKIEIINLSKLMVERNSELNRSKELDSYRNTLDQEIENIKREKKVIEDDLSMRTQEMLRRIVDRSNVKENIPQPKATKCQKSQGISLAPSLRARLSFNNEILSPVSSPEDAILPPSIQTALDAEVSCSSARAESPDSSQIVDLTSPPPEIEKDVVELDSVAVVDTRSENDGTSVLEPSVSQSDPVAVSIPEVTVTSSILGRPVSLRAILRPPPTLGVSSQNSLPSFARGPSGCLSAPTGNTFTSQPQTMDDKSESTSGDLNSAEVVVHSSQLPFKRPTEISRPQDAEGLSEPKKFKVLPSLPKSAVTRGPPKSSRAAPASGNSHQLKTAKRVSFVTSSQPQRGGNSLCTNDTCSAGNSPIEPQNTSQSTPTSSQPVDQVRQPQTVQITSTSSKEENTVSPNQQTTPGGPQISEVQSLPSGTDNFPPPFSSPPQPFTAPNTPQGTSGNFDSIFSAIFSSPPTPNDSSMGFQFPIGDAQKQGSNEGQPQTVPPPSGQDFFSFFGGTPNTDQSKKSFSDNFFKLF